MGVSIARKLVLSGLTIATEVLTEAIRTHILRLERLSSMIPLDGKCVFVTVLCAEDLCWIPQMRGGVTQVLFPFLQPRNRLAVS